MFAVKHSPFDMIPQLRKRGEDGRKCPAFVMVKQSRDVFKQKICRPSGLSQAGNFKEESTSCVVKPFSSASDRKSLAGKSAAQEVKLRQVARVNVSGVWIVSFLLLNIVDRAIADVGMLVDLAVTNALETARAVQSRAETADPGKHIKVFYQVVSSPSCRESKKPRTSASMSPACSCFVSFF